MTQPSTSRQLQNADNVTQAKEEGVLKRSWHAVLSPFSSAALEALPDTSQRNRDRELRTDRIPEVLRGEDVGGVRETVVSDAPIGRLAGKGPVSVRVPKKIPTAIKVEGKVWFANERTWLSYLNIGILIGTLALALFNASDDVVARNFAYVYAFISIVVLVYGWVVYQKRITMIRKRDPGHYDQILGPICISAFLFLAVLTNFIIRLQEVRRKGVPVPEK